MADELVYYYSEAWSVYNPGDKIIYEGKELTFGVDAFADMYEAFSAAMMAGAEFRLASSGSLNTGTDGEKVLHVCSCQEWKDCYAGDPCFVGEDMFTYGTDAFSSIEDALANVSDTTRTKIIVYNGNYGDVVIDGSVVGKNAGIVITAGGDPNAGFDIHADEAVFESFTVKNCSGDYDAAIAIDGVVINGDLNVEDFDDGLTIKDCDLKGGIDLSGVDGEATVSGNKVATAYVYKFAEEPAIGDAVTFKYVAADGEIKEMTGFYGVNCFGSEAAAAAAGSNVRDAYASEADILATLHVDDDWATGYTKGDVITLADGSRVYYGVNAFSNFTAAVAAAPANVETTIKLADNITGTTTIGSGKNIKLIDASGSGAVTISSGAKVHIKNGIFTADKIINNTSNTYFSVQGESTVNINDLSGTGRLDVYGTLKDSTIKSSTILRFFNAITFTGDNYLKAKEFSTGENASFTIVAGASLKTGTHFSLGGGRHLYATGSLAEGAALTLDAAALASTKKTLDLVGINIAMASTGVVTVTNAYADLGELKTTTSSEGTYTYTFTNSYVEATSLALSSSKNGAGIGGFTLTLDGSVFTLSSAALKFSNASVIVKNGSVLKTTSNVTNYGAISVTGSSVDIAGTITNTGDITVTDGSFAAGTITLSSGGTLSLSVSAAKLATIGAEGYTIVNQTGSGNALDLSVNIGGTEYGIGESLTANGVTYTVTDGDGNDIAIEASVSTLYVNSAYTADSVLPEGQIWGFNAFSTLTDAVKAADSTTTNIKLCSDVDFYSNAAVYLQSNFVISSIDDTVRNINWVWDTASGLFNGNASDLTITFDKSVVINGESPSITFGAWNGATVKLEGETHLQQLWAVDGEVIISETAKVTIADETHIRRGGVVTVNGLITDTTGELASYNPQVSGGWYWNSGNKGTVTLNFTNTYWKQGLFDGAVSGSDGAVVINAKRSIVQFSDMEVCQLNPYIADDGHSISLTDQSRLVAASITLGNDLYKAALTAEDSSVEVSGALNIGSEGVLELSGSTLAASGITNNGTITVNGGTFTAGSVSGSGNFNIAGGVDASGNAVVTTLNIGSLGQNVYANRYSTDPIVLTGSIDVLEKDKYVRVYGDAVVTGLKINAGYTGMLNSATGAFNVYDNATITGDTEMYLNSFQTSGSGVIKSGSVINTANYNAYDNGGTSSGTEAIFTIEGELNTNSFIVTHHLYSSDDNDELIVAAGGVISAVYQNGAGRYSLQKGKVTVYGYAYGNLTAGGADYSNIGAGGASMNLTVDGTYAADDNNNGKFIKTGNQRLWIVEDSEVNVINGALFSWEDKVTNDGTVTVSDSTFTAGTVNNGENDPVVGGIFNISNSTFTAGSVSNKGTITVSDSTFTAGSITNSGTISLTVSAEKLATIGAEGYTIVNQTGTGNALDLSVNIGGTEYGIGESLTANGVTYTVTNGDGNDIAIEASASTLYVNSAYADPAAIPEGMVYGFNAFSSMNEITNKINTTGGDTTVCIESDITPVSSLVFNCGTGNVKFISGGTPVKVAFTGTGDFVFTSGAPTVTIGEGVTFSTYNNNSDFVFYYGASLDLYGTVSGGANYGATYFYNGNHVVHTTGTIATGRIHHRLATLTVNGIENGVSRYAADVAIADRTDAQIDVNFIFNCSGSITASDTYITVGDLTSGGDGHGIYDTNKGGVQDSGSASSFDITNTKVETYQIKLSKSTTTFELTNCVVSVTDAVSNAGTITIDSTAFTAGSITNNGTITVSGDSKLNIASVTGNAIAIDGVTSLTDSVIGGNIIMANGDALTFYGDNTVNNISTTMDNDCNSILKVANGATLTIKDGLEFWKHSQLYIAEGATVKVDGGKFLLNTSMSSTTAYYEVAGTLEIGDHQSNINFTPNGLISGTVIGGAYTWGINFYGVSVLTGSVVNAIKTSVGWPDDEAYSDGENVGDMLHIKGGSYSGREAITVNEDALLKITDGGAVSTGAIKFTAKNRITGAMELDGAGSVVTLSGDLDATNAASVSVSNGAAVTANSLITGTSTVFTLSGATANFGAISNSGDLTAQNGAEIAASGVVTNSGLMKLDNAKLTSSAGGSNTFVNEGELKLTNGSEFTARHINNAGTITIDSSKFSTFAGSGNCGLNSGTISVVNGGTLHLSRKLESTGTVTIDNAKLTGNSVALYVSGGTTFGTLNIVNGATYTAESASLQLGGGGVLNVDNGAVITILSLQMGAGGRAAITGGSTVYASNSVSNSTVGSNITIDATSSLICSSIYYKAGSVTIDASNFAGGFKKIIDSNRLGSNSSFDNVTITGLGAGVNVLYGSDGDISLSDADLSKIYVNSEWNTLAYGEEILNSDGSVKAFFGVNAFTNVADALSAVPSFNAGEVVFESSTTGNVSGGFDLEITEDVAFTTPVAGGVEEIISGGDICITSTTNATSDPDNKPLVTVGEGVTLKTAGNIWLGWYNAPDFAVNGTLHAGNALWIGAVYHADGDTTRPVMTVGAAGKLYGALQYVQHDDAQVTINGNAASGVSADQRSVQFEMPDLVSIYSGTLTLNNTRAVTGMLDINNAYPDYVAAGRDYDGSYVVLNNSCWESASSIALSGVSGLTLKNGSEMIFGGDAAIGASGVLTISDSKFAVGGTIDTDADITISGNSTLAAGKIAGSGKLVLNSGNINFNVTGFSGEQVDNVIADGAVVTIAGTLMTNGTITGATKYNEAGTAGYTLNVAGTLYSKYADGLSASGAIYVSNNSVVNVKAGGILGLDNISDTTSGNGTLNINGSGKVNVEEGGKLCFGNSNIVGKLNVAGKAIGHAITIYDGFNTGDMAGHVLVDGGEVTSCNITIGGASRNNAKYNAAAGSDDVTVATLELVNGASLITYASGTNTESHLQNFGSLIVNNSTLTLQAHEGYNNTILTNEGTVTVTDGSLTTAKFFNNGGKVYFNNANINISEYFNGNSGDGSYTEISGRSTVKIDNFYGDYALRVADGAELVDSVISGQGTTTLRALGDLTIASDFTLGSYATSGFAYFRRDNDDCPADLTIADGSKLTVQGQFSWYNGTISGGTIEARYVQLSENTVKTDITAENVYLYDGTVIDGVTVTHNGTNGEPIYVRGDITVENGGTLQATGTNAIHIGASNYTGRILTATSGAKVIADSIRVNLADCGITVTSGAGVEAGSITNAGIIKVNNATIKVANTLTNNGTILMDCTSTIAFKTFAGSGTVTVDVSGYTGGSCLILDSLNNNYTEAQYQAILGSSYGTGFTVIGGDLYYVDYSSTDVYVNSTYSATGDNDGHIWGVDAFATIEDAAAVNPAHIVITDGSSHTSNTMFNGAAATISGGTFTASVAGGSSVSLTGRNWAEFDGAIDFTIEDGTFTKTVSGADYVVSGYAVHMADIDFTIKGGSFASTVGGGMAYTAASSRGAAEVEGDINFTIAGGTFARRVYGGNISRAAYSDSTRVFGDINLTIDSSVNSVAFGEHIVAGSFGTGKVEGNINVVFTGNGSNLNFTNTLVGGSGDSYRYVDSATSEWVYVTYVTGERNLEFSNFDGDFDGKIVAFSNISFTDGSEMAFTNTALDFSDIESWNFGGGSSVEALGANDFAGDTLKVDVNGWNTTAASTWDILSGSEAFFTGWDAFGGVSVGGTTLTFDGTKWAGGNYELSLEDDAEGKKLMISFK